MPAQAVVAADVELMELRAEEAELTRRLGSVQGSGCCLLRVVCAGAAIEA